MKRKYLAQWVQVMNSCAQHSGKIGVVMDEEYLHNGVLCCRIIIEKGIIAVEAHHLKKIQI